MDRKELARNVTAVILGWGTLHARKADLCVLLHSHKFSNWRKRGKLNTRPDPNCTVFSASPERVS